MAGDDLHVLGLLAQVVGHGQGHIAVRGAVEAVAAHAVLLVILIGQAVHIGPGGHGGVEGGVEHQHVGNLVAKHLAGAAQALHAGGVVQGSQGGQLLILGNNFIGHQHALVEGLAAVDAPVADGADFADVVNGLALAGGHLLHHLVEGLHMGGHGAGLGPLLTVLLMGDAAALVADALAQALAQQLLIVHVDELILQGRGTAVDDQNVHKNISFFCDFRYNRCALRRKCAYFPSGKLVKFPCSTSGAPMVSRPAAMALMRKAMLRPRFRMVWSPSASFSTSAAVKPWT